MGWRGWLGVALAIGLLLGWGFTQRRLLILHAVATGERAPLLVAAEEGPGVEWVDDYFTTEFLDADTIAIGEPRFAQQNFNYLIIGSERAVLFDAGPGVRDIRTLAESLTDRPITFVPSHFHYDHLGDRATFARVAVVDLPALRTRAPEDDLELTTAEHLGFAEGIAIPTLHVTEWLKPNSILSLGDRELLVLHTPGHTEDSISLVDLSRGWIFSGDFIYPGELYGFLPNSSMGDYLDGANAILGVSAPPDARILGAHRVAPPGAPRLALGDVLDLRKTLEAIRARKIDGEGLYPVAYPVNDRVTMLAEPRWLQRWGD
jgi:glyoxylase-like metal-dependent hydrolase (beta-lactamase superfamily II)